MDSEWLNAFWQELTKTRSGIRVQVHTHPGRAFHSPTDDAWPIVHTPGFLSFVIPDFANGPASFAGAYLAQLRGDGCWEQAAITDHLVVV